MIKESILPPHEIIIAEHNVGKGGVLDANIRSVQRAVDIYQARGSDHVPTIEHNLPSFLITEDPELHGQQTNYRSKIANQRIITAKSMVDVTRYLAQDYGLDEIMQQRAIGALYVPYVRLQELPKTPHISTIEYGLPPRITRLLKNKATAHETFSNSEYAECIPNHIICDAREIHHNGKIMLQKQEHAYAELGVDHFLGLFIRGELNDGTFGGMALKQAQRDEMVSTSRNSVSVLKNQIMALPDGKTDNLRVFNNWESALDYSSSYVAGCMDPERQSRVVMTRLLDLEASPGQSAVIIKGRIHCLDWNDQWRDPGENACTGTASWTIKGNLNMQNRYVGKTSEFLAGTVEPFLANEKNRESVYAWMNTDFMIVGEQELNLWEAANRLGVVGTKYKNSVGKNNHDYEIRVYDPDVPLYAEHNPRLTNYGLLVWGHLQAQHRQFTLENVISATEGSDSHLLARDKWKLPEGVYDMDLVRDVLYQYHESVQDQGAGFILRMPAMNGESYIGTIGYTNPRSMTIPDLYRNARAAISQATQKKQF